MIIIILKGLKKLTKYMIVQVASYLKENMSYVFLSEDKKVRVLNNLDFILSRFIYRDIEIMSLDIKILRVGLLQLLWKEKIYTQEVKCENLKDGIIDGKYLENIDSMKSL